MKFSEANRKFLSRPLVIGLAGFIFATYTLPMVVLTVLKWGEIASRPIVLSIMFYGMGIFATSVASTLAYLHFKAKKQNE